MRSRRLWLAALTLALCALLSGCFVKTVDELYALPRHSDEYDNLQRAIDAVMDEAGCEYSAPVSGSNRQSVQLADLDGDGEDEAVVFAKTAGEKPLKAYVFDRQDGSYQNIAVIEGDGAEFSCAQYVSMDDAPGLELLLGRKLSDQVLQSLSVYTLSDGVVTEQMTANYSQFTVADLDNDGKNDLLLLRLEADSVSGVAELCRFRSGRMERGHAQSLSAGAVQLRRITTGLAAYNIPAVFVTSAAADDSLVTDVFVFRGGALQNLSAQSDAPHGARNALAYACDINGDGIVELPALVSLPAADAQEQIYSLIRWYQLGLDGSQTVVLRTYHRFSDGWYVEIPESWDERITISRAEDTAQARGLTFSAWNGAEPSEPIFTIYAFTGAERQAQAQKDGRFVLLEQGQTVYAAALSAAAEAEGLTQESLRGLFHIIHVDWNTGETLQGEAVS